MPSVTVTVIGKVPVGVGVRRFTVAEPDLVASACDVATTLTAAGLGRVAGAVYRPVALIVPLPLPPVTDHVTAVLVELVTVAVNC